MSAQECVFCCCSSPCIHGRRHSAVVSLRACVLLFDKRCVWSGGHSAATVGAGLLPVGAGLYLIYHRPPASPRSYLWVTRPSPRCWKGGVGVSADLGGRPFSSAAVAALAMSCVDFVRTCRGPNSVEGFLLMTRSTPLLDCDYFCC